MIKSIFFINFFFLILFFLYLILQKIQHITWSIKMSHSIRLILIDCMLNLYILNLPFQSDLVPLKYIRILTLFDWEEGGGEGDLLHNCLGGFYYYGSIPNISSYMIQVTCRQVLSPSHLPE